MTILDAEIRGMSFHAGAYEKLKMTSSRTVVTLKREPLNRYDKNAVEVHIDKTMIGHVARERAVEVAAAMDAGQMVRATLRGFRHLRIDTHYKGRDVRPPPAPGKADPELNDEIPI